MPVDPKSETSHVLTVQQTVTLGPCVNTRFSITEEKENAPRSVFVLLDVRPSSTGNGQLVNVSIKDALSDKDQQQLFALLTKLHVAAAHAAGFTGE